MNTAARAVFLDRDGTLGGSGGFCHPDEFELYPFAAEAIRRVNDAGLKVVSITNQSRISKSQITLEQVESSFQRIQRELETVGAHLDAWYVCPHRESDLCECKKPKPGLLFRAARELQIDLRRSVMIGDTGDGDIRAGSSAGCRTVLVLTGWGASSLGAYRHTWADLEPDFIAQNVLEAVDWALEQDRVLEVGDSRSATHG